MLIQEITEYNADVLAIFRKLLPQLSKNAPEPTEAMARDIINSTATRLLVAKEEEHALGMLTLVIFPIPTGVRAWIEDVVVDSSGRGKGVGAALSQQALSLAAQEGAKTVDLTSRASRVAANSLYQTIGFEQRDTNVYRYQLDA